MLASILSKGSLSTSLSGAQVGSSIKENIIEVLQRLKATLHCILALQLLGKFPKNLKLLSQSFYYILIFTAASFHKSHNIKRTLVSLNRWIDTEMLRYTNRHKIYLTERASLLINGNKAHSQHTEGIPQQRLMWISDS